MQLTSLISERVVEFKAVVKPISVYFEKAKGLKLPIKII